MKISPYLGIFITKSDRRISQIDGWRGISVLLVVIGHLVTFHYDYDNSVLGQIADELAELGVMAFFVVSGFIITKMALAERKNFGSFSIRNFYIRRFFRIVPPYFAFLGFVAVASLSLLIVQSFPGMIPAVLFVCNFPATNCDWFVGHSWSLAFEEQFYLVFPLVVALINPRLARSHGVLFLCLISITCAQFFLLGGDWWWATTVYSQGFWVICIGSVGATYEEELKTLARSRFAGLISIGASVSVAANILLGGIPSIHAASLGVHMQRTIDIVSVPPALVWLIVSSVHQRNWFTRMLSTTPLLFLGTISYSLYLWQQLFSAAPSYYMWTSPFPLWPLMFVVATLSYRFVERPAISLGKRLLARSTQSSSLGPVRPH